MSGGGHEGSGQAGERRGGESGVILVWKWAGGGEGPAGLGLPQGGSGVFIHSAPKDDGGGRWRRGAASPSLCLLYILFYRPHSLSGLSGYFYLSGSLSPPPTSENPTTTELQSEGGGEMLRLSRI